MADVLSEAVDDALTRADVERRVADWRARIDELFARVDGWLPAGWKTSSRPERLMHEEMMREFDIPAVQLPVLHIEGLEGERAQLEPRGLWIIGANGRLDLTGPAGHFIIVDKAENFDPPAWTIAPFSDRGRSRVLDGPTFLSAL